MSAAMQHLADLRADVEALTSEFRQLKATHPNLDRFAAEIGAHLIRFKTDVTRNFTDKFAGSFFRATEAITARVVNLEERQAKLEELLDGSINEYEEMLVGHRQEIGKLHRSHLAAVQKLLDDNGKKLAEQQATVARLLKLMQTYDAQFVTLINACDDLQQSSQQLMTKVDAAAGRFDQISTGTLKEVATEAQLAIKQTHDDAERNIVSTRTRFNKIMSGFDSKLSENPVLVLVLLIALISFFFGLLGNAAGRKLVKDNAQEMINESVAKAQETINQRVDEKLDALKEISEKMNRMVDDAQYWDMLTANMDYNQKMAYIKLAQERARREGRTLRVSNIQERPKK